MATIEPSLFKLLGAGFLSDHYAADGIHLRWMFDPRLGFPRNAVCLYRRPALGTGRATDDQVHWHSQRWDDGAAIPALTFPDLRIRHSDGSTFESKGGIALTATPLELSFSAQSPEGAACYVRLHLRVLNPGGKVTATAQYMNRDEAEAVDRASSSLLGKVTPLGNLLAQVPAAGPPVKLNDAQKSLYDKLTSLDAIRFKGASPLWLDKVAQTLKTADVSLESLVRGGSMTDVELVLRADRIDRVVITGSQARLVYVEWVTSAEYVHSKGWMPVTCVPAAGGDDDYLKRNAALFAGKSPADLAKERVLGLMPRGAEPLDAPVYPPARPPTDQERACRYLAPWEATLGPWLKDVLQQSQGGAKHMAEVTETVPFTDLGQRPGDGLPPEAGDATASVHPYNLLLAASTAFPVAQLLGLAYIDTGSVARTTVTTAEFAPVPIAGLAWDYMAVGRWLKKDIAAWGHKLLTDLQQAQQRVKDATPATITAAQAKLIAAMLALVDAMGEINALLAGAAGDVLPLYGLKLNLSLAHADDFAGPASLSATFEEPSVVEPGKGLTRLDWPLPKRARAMISEAVPVGACIVRGPAGASYADVLNPLMPSIGSCTNIRAAILPAGPEDAPGTPGTASYIDRATAEGVHYHYGVSQMDPFGRWSPFADTPFTWEDRSPPPEPLAVHAVLKSVSAGLELTVTFSWDRVRLPPDKYAFEIGLRRSTTLAGSDTWPANAAKRAYWQNFSRTIAGSTGPFRFLGTDASGLSRNHDGLTATMTFADVTLADPLGGSVPRRAYTVVFTGAFEVIRDTFLRTKLYAGVASQKLTYNVYSDDVGGPATAEQTDPAIPQPPTFPPDPQRASYADAEGLSTFALGWTGLANTRYQVLRAAERELVAALDASDARVGAWKNATTLAARAEALRDMARDARKVFAPRSDWIPEVTYSAPTGVGKLPVPSTITGGPRSFVDRLPGRAETLFVYALVARSASGEPSPWPTTKDGFTAVEVPVATQPSQPVVIRATWQPPMDPPPALAIEGNARAELTVVKPLGVDPASYELYRAASAADAIDERKMRRIHAAAPAWEDDGHGLQVARFVDPTVKPWTTYWYSLVARAGTVTTPGTRSPASRPVAVETASPDAPAAPVLAPLSSSSAAITATVDMPASALARFDFTLFRADQSPREVILTGAPASSGPTTITLPLSAALTAGSTVILRVRDPLGRTSESAPLVVT
ncbi:MAG: hypothetical protein U0359_02915 [Byssovorax sp.]